MLPAILTFNFVLNFGVIFDFLRPYQAIFGVEEGFKNCLGSTHVVEQLSFSMLLSILTFDLLIFGATFDFLGP